MGISPYNLLFRVFEIAPIKAWYMDCSIFLKPGIPVFVSKAKSS
jgi:hypothetical protein